LASAGPAATAQLGAMRPAAPSAISVAASRHDVGSWPAVDRGEFQPIRHDVLPPAPAARGELHEPVNERIARWEGVIGLDRSRDDLPPTVVPVAVADGLPIGVQIIVRRPDPAPSQNWSSENSAGSFRRRVRLAA